jgi:hypothetical protein
LPSASIRKGGLQSGTTGFVAERGPRGRVDGVALALPAAASAIGSGRSLEAVARGALSVGNTGTGGGNAALDGSSPGERLVSRE